MYGGIVYGLIGLVPEVSTFWKFILVLVLFNLTTASVILLLSIAFASTSVASLVGTLIMLFKCVMLFGVIFPLLTSFTVCCSLGCCTPGSPPAISSGLGLLDIPLSSIWDL